VTENGEPKIPGEHCTDGQKIKASVFLSKKNIFLWFWAARLHRPANWRWLPFLADSTLKRPVKRHALGTARRQLTWANLRGSTPTMSPSKSVRLNSMDADASGEVFGQITKSAIHTYLFQHVSDSHSMKSRSEFYLEREYPWLLASRSETSSQQGESELFQPSSVQHWKCSIKPPARKTFSQIGQKNQQR